MPYLYAQAINSCTRGHPIQRAMLVDFIGDRTTHSLDQQYMLGPNLLFAPVFGDEDHDTEYYLPSGKWTTFSPVYGGNRARVAIGPTWVREKVPLSEIPAYVRPGSVLVLGPPNTKKPDYDLAEDVEVQLYQFEEGSRVSCDIPTGHGQEVAATLQVEYTGGKMLIKVDRGSLNNWCVRLFQDGLSAISDVKGGILEVGEDGQFFIRAEGGCNEIVINV